MQDDHVLGLKAAGDAGQSFLGRGSAIGKNSLDERVGGERFVFGERSDGHAFPLGESGWPSRHLRSTFITRSTACSSVSSSMRTAKKESGPKMARTTCF